MLECRVAAGPGEAIDSRAANGRVGRESAQGGEDILRPARKPNADAGYRGPIAPLSARSQQGAVHRFPATAAERRKWQAVLRRGHRTARAASITPRPGL